MAKNAALSAAGDPSWWSRTLADAVRPDTPAFKNLWVGLEPTFSCRKAVKLWEEMSETEDGEIAWFSAPYLLRKERKVAQRIRDRYREARDASDEAAPFESVEICKEEDQWGVERRNIEFASGDCKLEVKFGLDPETFEYTIKPVPLLWLYDARFVAFLQRFVWDVPLDSKLSPSIAHGGGQFSLSAKTFLQGSLLADDLAYRLDHPELASFMLDWPNPDDRAFRATSARKSAAERLLASYWAGSFHPRAIGTLRACNALLDMGFSPAPSPLEGLIDPQLGPLGTPGEVFRTNFAFGRAWRRQVQTVHAGYWQHAHPDAQGYRPDQILRYNETNLARLQIAGELHVKSGEVLDPEDVPPFEAKLKPTMLYREASYEMRAQMSRISADDFVDAVLLQVHHAMFLSERPHVRVRSSLLQDQLLGDAEALLAQRVPERLGELHEAARTANALASRGRFKTDWIEPETLFWEAWRACTPGERAAIAVEAIEGFVQHVENAASKDPRPTDDPMRRHRHRICPVLWAALEAEPSALTRSAAVAREWRIWSEGRKAILDRRPPWSLNGGVAPWEELETQGVG